MKRNICKLPDSSFRDILTVGCFVLETNSQTAASLQKLAKNRMLLAVSGEGILQFDDICLELNVGNLYFGFAGETLSVKQAKDASYMYIDFEGPRAQDLIHRFNINKMNRSFENFDGLIPMWSESLSRASEQTTDLAAEGILLYTFSRLAGQNGGQSTLLNRIIELTEERFKEQGFSLAELAKELTYNPKYLSHFFKQKMNLSYSEYLCTLRLKYAISLFDYGIGSVKNAALLSGFSDPLYFSNVFKKKIGISPKEYIARRSR